MTDFLLDSVTESAVVSLLALFYLANPDYLKEPEWLREQVKQRAKTAIKAEFLSYIKKQLD